MNELFASGRVVDGILVLVALELLLFAFLRRRSGRGISPGALLPNLAAGALLLLALRGALVQAGWRWIASCLAVAFVAHAVDVWRRSRG